VGVRQPEHEAGHSHPSTTEVKMGGAVPFTPLICVFTFLQYVQSVSWHSCISINLLAMNLEIYTLAHPLCKTNIL
jgi:hypothetical protein